MASILIVDDDYEIGDVFSVLLRCEGHRVRIARSGAEGLASLMAEELPDCVLLDVEMPGMTGPGMAHEMLLRDAGQERIPILLLSSHTDLATIAARMGTPYFLSKNAGRRPLLALLGKLLHDRLAPTSA